MAMACVCVVIEGKEAYEVERKVRVKESERRWQEEGIELRRKCCKNEKPKDSNAKQLMERVSAMVEKCSGQKVFMDQQTLMQQKGV